MKMAEKQAHPTEKRGMSDAMQGEGAMSAEESKILEQELEQLDLDSGASEVEDKVTFKPPPALSHKTHGCVKRHSKINRAGISIRDKTSTKEQKPRAFNQQLARSGERYLTVPYQQNTVVSVQISSDSEESTQADATEDESDTALGEVALEYPDHEQPERVAVQEETPHHPTEQTVHTDASAGLTHTVHTQATPNDVPVIKEPCTDIKRFKKVERAEKPGLQSKTVHSPGTENNQQRGRKLRKSFSNGNLNICDQQRLSEHLHAELTIQKSRREERSRSKTGASMRSRYWVEEAEPAPSTMRPTSKSSGEKRSVTFEEVDQPKSKPKSRSSNGKAFQVANNPRYAEFEDRLETCVRQNCKKFKEKFEKPKENVTNLRPKRLKPKEAPKDDLGYWRRPGGSFTQPLVIYLLLILDTHVRHKYFEVLLDKFEKDMTDVVIPCTQEPNVLRIVNNHSKKSYNVGCGGFGHVYKMTNIDSEVYAKKRLLHKFEKNEVKFLYKLGCDADSRRHFPRLYGFSREQGDTYIRQEYVDSTWRKAEVMKPLQYLVMFREALEALVCLAKHGIYHRDIKPSNIGCSIYGEHSRFLDFGSSQSPREKFGLWGMTPSYTPPEVIAYEEYHANSDVYQLGLAVLWLVTDYIPYEDQRISWPEDDNYKIKLLIRGNPEIISEKAQAAVIAPEWKHLLLQMLDVDPDTRVTAKDALQHQIFRDSIIPLVDDVTRKEKHSSDASISKSSRDRSATTEMSDLGDLAEPAEGVLAEDDVMEEESE